MPVKFKVGEGVSMEAVIDADRLRESVNVAERELLTFIEEVVDCD